MIDYEYPLKKLEKYCELKDKYLPIFMKENNIDESFNIPEGNYSCRNWKTNGFFRLLYLIGYQES